MLYFLVKEILQGFEIKISSSGTCNQTGFTSATSCYKDTTTTPQDIYTIDRCNQPTSTSISARTVYITVSSQYLNLCEVEIFSAQCNTGYYSTSSSTCQACNTCRNDSCDSTTGVCTGECKTGFYGTRCQQNCSDSCLNNQCSKSDGKCNDCKPDTVGPYCNLTCATECQPISDETSVTCDRNGICTNCITGRYGDRCGMNCSTECVDGCSRLAGRCTNCVVGIYGFYCDENCNTGCNGGCARSSGRCTTCIKGKTGERCDKKCNTDCTVCNQGNPDSCTECKDGRWGSSCNKLCNTNCKSVVNTTVGKCNITSGLCTDGCITGYMV
ncbi:multiple epidermal growth factor-like domains protein 11 [Patella vulgata]|uniref:multiple epidermal growth factor-like domains protein 11 n=1 Tax=Patella vulgata TaxID=6465 RepID=UPI00218062AB|nr:multiple epidermal growth factor-like domains protein 11 [Patella vulgata]